MRISNNNNLQTQRYNPIGKNGKVATGDFALPETQDMPTTEAFGTPTSEKVSDEDFRIFQNDLMSRARVLPPEILNSNALLKFQEIQTAKIVFEFGESASIRIKEGLSQADYLRAKKTLEEIELWRQGK